MITTLYHNISVGTPGDDVGVTLPDPDTTPTTQEELLGAPIRLGYLLAGDDDIGLNFPALTVISAGDGDDRIEENTNFFAFGIAPPNDATYFQVYGGDGDDTLIGGIAPDVLIGGPGADQLLGGFGSDLLIANSPEENFKQLAIAVHNFHDTTGALLHLPRAPIVSLEQDGGNFLSGGPGFDAMFGGYGDVFSGDSGIDHFFFVFDPDAPPPPGVAPPNVTDHQQFVDKSWFLGMTPPSNPVDVDNYLFQLFDSGSGVNTIDIAPKGDRVFTHSVQIRSDGIIPAVLFGGMVANVLTTVHALRANGASIGPDDINLSSSLQYPAIFTLGGDDTLTASGDAANQDLVTHAGAGNDHITTGNGNDVLVGDKGSDTLAGGPGDDIITDGGGLFFGETADVALVAGLFDHLVPSFEHEFDRLSGDDGNDILITEGGEDHLTGGNDADVFAFLQDPALGPVAGFPIVGDFAPDDGDSLYIHALQSNPNATVELDPDAASGDTRVMINPDGAGPDAAAHVVTLLDTLVGDVADLLIVGFNAVKAVSGTLFATQGSDAVTADLPEVTSYLLGGGNDSLSGATGDVQVDGEAGNDSLQGGPGNDLIAGGAGNDTVAGGPGADFLQGDGRVPSPFDAGDSGEPSGGDDSIDAGDGDDLILPGGGNDTIDGGPGSDLTIFIGRNSIGGAIFEAFDAGADGDRILFDSVFALVPGLGLGFGAATDYVVAVQDGADTVLWGDLDGIGVGNDTLDKLVVLEGFDAPSLLINSQVLLGDPYEENNAPTSSDDSESTPVNTPLFGVLPPAFDPDGDAVSYSLAAPPSTGFAFIGGNGAFVYVPEPDFVGPDPFDFTVADGRGGSNSYTAALTVTLPNRPPVSMDRAYAAIEDTPLNGDLRLPPPAPSDPDGDPVSHALHLQASNGSADIDPDGSFTYAPAPNFFGADSFEFKVRDGKGGENTYTAQITIPDAPDFFTGTPGDDTIVDDSGGKAQIDGLGGDDVLLGNNGNDTLLGGPGDDTLFGGPGDDKLNGGDGTDVAASDAALAEILAEWNSGSGTLTEKNGSPGPSGIVSKDLPSGTVAVVASKGAPASAAPVVEKANTGTDTFTGIERLKFTDTILAIDSDQFGDNTYDAVAMFNGAFDRLPTADELARFLPVTDAGGDVAGVAQAMLDFYVPGGIDNPTLVAYLYLQLFGVPAPQDQIDLYAGLIDDGTFTQATLAAAGAMLSVNVVEFAGLIADGIALPLGYH